MSQSQATKPVPACSIKGCERPAKHRGWCGAHYQRWQRYGDPNGSASPASPLACAADECDDPSRSLGLCERHYRRFKRHGDLLNHREQAAQCVEDGCDLTPYALNLCAKHYARTRRQSSGH